MIDKILPGFAGIDIGAAHFFVAAAGAPEPVKRFGTFTSEIALLSAYLKDHAVTKVAMEATGVYWIPLHDHLEREGIEVTVFNGAHARNLPGRKSDAADCQWHAMLHSHGLLTPCFIPPQEILELRTFYRLREDHLSMAASHILHMQRALDLMNVRLHNVISQIQGVSGLRVIRAILTGERDPQTLVGLCEGQILHKKRDQVIKSLEGQWQEHHLFVLRQALECYEFYQEKIAACDGQIDLALTKLRKGVPVAILPAGRKSKKVRHNAPEIENLHGKLLSVSGGCDPTQIAGISPLSFMKLLSEVGTDLTAWKSEKHFTSWLGLAPGKHESGKKRRRAPRPKTAGGQIFRECVLSIAKSKFTALGAFYRRLKARKGPAVAATAVARKLAELYYRAMTKGMDYVERGVAHYEKVYRQQTVRYLQKMAANFGLTVSETPAAATA
jgi:transposase